MITGFRDVETERLFAREPKCKISRQIQRVALRKLAILHAATSLDELSVPPGNRLEKLVGDRAGAYSIRINEQYRICFCWDGGDAYDVEIVDYHA